MLRLSRQCGIVQVPDFRGHIFPSCALNVSVSMQVCIRIVLKAGRDCLRNAPTGRAECLVNYHYKQSVTSRPTGVLVEAYS